MYDETVTNRINALQPPYREFILSDMPRIIAEEFGDTYKLDDARLGALGNAIMLLLTFLLNKDQFTQFVSLECELSNSESENLYWGVVMSLPEDIRKLFSTTTSSLGAAPLTSPSTTTPTSNSGSTSESVPTVRTMPPVPAAPAETVYTSTQAAILHESAGTPPATEPNAPRWDTAR